MNEERSRRESRESEMKRKERADLKEKIGNKHKLKLNKNKNANK